MGSSVSACDARQPVARTSKETIGGAEESRPQRRRSRDSAQLDVPSSVEGEGEGGGLSRGGSQSTTLGASESHDITLEALVVGADGAASLLPPPPGIAVDDHDAVRSSGGGDADEDEDEDADDPAEQAPAPRSPEPVPPPSVGPGRLPDFAPFSRRPLAAAGAFSDAADAECPLPGTGARSQQRQQQRPNEFHPPLPSVPSTVCPSQLASASSQLLSPQGVPSGLQSIYALAGMLREGGGGDGSGERAGSGNEELLSFTPIFQDRAGGGAAGSDEAWSLSGDDEVGNNGSFVLLAAAPTSIFASGNAADPSAAAVLPAVSPTSARRFATDSGSDSDSGRGSSSGSSGGSSGSSGSSGGGGDFESIDDFDVADDAAALGPPPAIPAAMMVAVAAAAGCAELR